VVVIGLGGFGSAALWRLAQRGVDVARVERQDIGHHLPAFIWQRPGGKTLWGHGSEEDYEVKVGMEPEIDPDSAGIDPFLPAARRERACHDQTARRRPSPA
jgi:cation diffusion facilitator CzcD-associated flavoprotein CzcO